ncbi:CubicO group peptidase, beta-lactamase class C family [Granulicella rosea]|uniref:CubicO group peptidase, beta-lactamase class C family n=1 Tax=Granulicella rosea TaxID=474952 RepID=A0A239LNR2_9BACT|nr:serine hydrolase domain-containing protein [Granulicella rosea]SNT31264.1 CubicO group peptidase, beta-lactamase class C family [Granulicella rosea]
MKSHGLLAAAVLGIGCHAALAQDLAPDLRARIDAAIQQVVAKTGVPSASVGIARDGKIVFTQAFGDARLSPKMAATAAMRYPIGSVTKQFTAACVLLLAEQGKLTLDDSVSRWFPELTRSNEVTVRELLSHTSGYEDYAPQDYTIPAWTKPVDPRKVVEEWATKPLDFDPGTEWQYSNTNFVLAALIVEKASGTPFYEFLDRNILKPLALTGALNLDTQRNLVEPQGYERHALAPLSPAKLEAPGWYYGDANLALTPADLLRWDISIMKRSLLKPASYDAFESAVKLKSGKETTYGLGIGVYQRGGRRLLEHSGEVGGFVSENIVWPDDGIAIVVLTNQEASNAASLIAKAIAPLVVPADAKPAAAAPADDAVEAQTLAILKGLQAGSIDRSLFTPDANFYFSATTLAEFASSLHPLGAVTSVKKQRENLRGGMVAREYEAVFTGGRSVSISTYTLADGKLEQFLVEGK